MANCLYSLSGLMLSLSIGCWAAEAAPVPEASAQLVAIEAPPARLVPGTEYRVVRMNDQEVAADIAPTMTFDAAENRVSGFTGINRYGAGYQVADTVLTIGQTISTQMAGEEAAATVEKSFLALIGDPLTISRTRSRAHEPDGLRLGNAKGSVVIVAVPAAAAK